MRLPDLVAYQAAVQHPATAFSDPALKSASVAIGRLGLPRAVAGNFAVTYQLRSGTRRWAVRCFHREADDRASRYAAISRTLVSGSGGPLVPIEYLQSGVRVGQVWFPITKMPWVEGHPLNVAIERELGKADRLESLERSFSALVEELRKRGLAHGDLQHGNILVDPQGILRLVDYDGMFVPALQGRTASECGDPNYQHPRRTVQFDADLDRFASIVIVVALRALAVEPALWRTYNTGDNLLFRRTDFADPSHSALFRDLCGLPGVRELAERLARVCEDEYSRVPLLADFLRRATPVAAALPNRPRSWKLRRGSPQVAIAFAPDDQQVASGDADGKLSVRASADGRTQPGLQPQAARSPGVLRALGFTSAGELRMVISQGANLTLATSERVLRELEAGHRMVRAVALSSNAEWLAAAGDDGVVRCWKLAAPKGLALGLAVSGIKALAISDDGRYVALSHGRGPVQVWQVRPGCAQVATLEVGRGATCLAFSADSQRVVSGTSSGWINVWDLASGEPVCAGVELESPITSVALSRDGARVATSARDGTVCVRRVRPYPMYPMRPAKPGAEPLRIGRVFDWLRRVALL